MLRGRLTAVVWMGVVLASTGLGAGCGYFGYDTFTTSLFDASVDSSSSTDAANSDAGATTADGGVPCAKSSTAVVCTDFDDTSGFTTFVSNGLVQIVSGVLDTQTLSPGAYASLVATFAPITTGTMHFTGHMRIVGNFTISDVNPLMVGNRFETDYGLDYDLVGGGMLRVNQSGGMSFDSAVTLPRDTWICIQGEIVLGNTNGSLEVRADGATLVTQTNVDTLPPNGLQHVSIGIDWTSGMQGNARIQWDDFVLARANVPCN